MVGRALCKTSQHSLHQDILRPRHSGPSSPELDSLAPSYSPQEIGWKRTAPLSKAQRAAESPAQLLWATTGANKSATGDFSHPLPGLKWLWDRVCAKEHRLDLGDKWSRLEFYCKWLYHWSQVNPWAYFLVCLKKKKKEKKRKYYYLLLVKYKKFMQVLKKQQLWAESIFTTSKQDIQGRARQKGVASLCEVPPSSSADCDCDVSLLPNNLPATSTHLFHVPPIIVLFPITELMSDNGLTVYS